LRGNHGRLVRLVKADRLPFGAFAKQERQATEGEWAPLRATMADAGPRLGRLVPRQHAEARDEVPDLAPDGGAGRVPAPYSHFTTSLLPPALLCGLPAASLA
jgi:hypothetical protein